MKLNLDGKAELRIKINDFLHENHYRMNSSTLIKLDKEELEDLLFDIKLDANNNERKIISFNSDNIDCLDLSEVDFENVSLDCKSYNKEMINLANTNAKIDFYKTYEYKNIKEIHVSNINLNGVDLSNGIIGNRNIPHLGITFDNVMLQSTGIQIEDQLNQSLEFNKCNLGDNDLSNLVCTFRKNKNYLNKEDATFDISAPNTYSYGVISNCNLRNTGITIKLYSNCNDKDDFRRIISNPRHQGCYVSGNVLLDDHSGVELKNYYIKTDGESIAEAQKKLEEYKKYKAGVINGYLDKIQSQINPVESKTKTYANSNK